MKKEKILGFNVITCNEQELLKNIFKDYEQNNQIFIVNINPEIAINNYKNESFKKILNEQKYQLPDGSGIVWASKLRKGNENIVTFAGKTGIKPVLLVFAPEKIDRVISEFINVLEKHGLHDNKGVYKAIGAVRKEQSSGLKIGSY